MKTFRTQWIALSQQMPEPEVFVLCWDGKKCFVDWWGSLRDNGNGATHWMPFPQPPGASDMYDGQRAIRATNTLKPHAQPNSMFEYEARTPFAQMLEDR